MFGEGPDPPSLEDGKTGPYQKAQAPCGLSVRIPDHRVARRESKLFERVIADRLAGHISRVVPDLAGGARQWTPSCV